MRPTKHGIVRLLVLANYLLAVAVSMPILHYVEHGRGPSRYVCDSVHARHLDAKSCGHSSYQADSCRPDDHRGKGSPSRSHDEGTCPICKFLSQKPILADNVAEVTSAPLEQEAKRAEPTQRAEPVPSANHIRAPPALA